MHRCRCTRPWARWDGLCVSFTALSCSADDLGSIGKRCAQDKTRHADPSLRPHHPTLHLATCPQSRWRDFRTGVHAPTHASPFPTPRKHHAASQSGLVPILHPRRLGELLRQGTCPAKPPNCPTFTNVGKMGGKKKRKKKKSLMVLRGPPEDPLPTFPQGPGSLPVGDPYATRGMVGGGREVVRVVPSCRAAIIVAVYGLGMLENHVGLCPY
ncbi:hypothetical protein B0H67DRAFT_595201 [Lasiosphaeris hirsuta]|uniref:Uncharacterized protein n=1 Tax=Lasiosphaeris hirsuta TaxID=260670 RepID=A0AA39ZR27_9PEZI|nr:hypothetical protein B0H67DRAFT_595201 [Lasiosphaeris hirsuta]